MVCLEGGKICIPKDSISNEPQCFPKELICDGNIACRDGSDEKDCSNEALHSGGIVALIAICCILVVAAIPVIYIIVRKKKGLPILPQYIRDSTSQCLKLFKSDDSGTNDRSESQLAGDHSTISHSSSANKDGFTNVSFEPPSYSSGTHDAQPKLSVTSRFHKNVDAEDRLPSIREWQSNRLNQGKDSPRIHQDWHSSTLRDGSQMSSGGYYNQAQDHDRPPDYSQVSRLQLGSELRPPPSNNVNSRPPVRSPGLYNLSDHLQGTADVPATNLYQQFTEATDAPWNKHSKPAADEPWNQPSQRQSGPDGIAPRALYSSSQATRPPVQYGYSRQSQYSDPSAAVSPNKLRTALERVSVQTTRQQGYYTRERSPPMHEQSGSADTVV